MPYSKATLAQTGNSLSLEMKGLLDTALTNSGKYTRVTTAYVSSTRTYDVWRNDGTTDGYEWYLVVMTDTANTGRLHTSGALEYDDATKIAKKALRGYSGVGFVGADGYQTTSAGGPESTYALANFNATTSNISGNTSAAVGAQPTAAAATNIMRVLVTGQVVWFWYGTVSAGTHCQGVGTYQTLHGQTWDLKPLAFLAHNASTVGGGGTVWQNPNATYTNPRATTSSSIAGGTPLGQECWSTPIGKVGGSGQDMNYGSNYVGSRMQVIREQAAQGLGGGGNITTMGYHLGLAPADFLIFGKQAGTAIGDTVQVGSNIYESVSNPAAGAGLFINTTPSV